MRAGRLSSVVQFQSERSTADDIGGRTVEYRDEFIVRGWLRPQLGREALEAGRLESSAFGVLVIRYDPSLAAEIQPSWRCLIDGEEWQVVNINRSVVRNESLEMIVQRGVAQ